MKQPKRPTPRRYWYKAGYLQACEDIIDMIVDTSSDCPHVTYAEYTQGLPSSPGVPCHSQIERIEEIVRNMKEKK